MKVRTTAFARMLDRYGQTVAIHPEGEELDIPVQAFLQPVLNKKESWFQQKYSVLGRGTQELFLYLGPAGLPLDRLGNGYIEGLGKRFNVQAAEAVFVGTEASHWWALLSPREEDGQCP